MGKSVKVHDDTHEALKRIKAEKRSKSIDEGIREMVKQTTGTPVQRGGRRDGSAELTSYMKG
jgi:predicted CopG family antitoxin